jgi:hypothetical protein
MACPSQNRAIARNIRLSIKSAGKRIILGVRSSIVPSYSGILSLSINAAIGLEHDFAPLAAF